MRTTDSSENPAPCQVVDRWAAHSHARAMEYFRLLGEDLRATWETSGFAAGDLPAIATDALTTAWARSPPPSLDEVLRWLWTADELPEQEDLERKFGQPPITLYNCSEFHISLLLWHTGTTSCHQHGFSGAFSVLHGSSLQGRYRFQLTRPIDARINIGTLELQAVDVLTPGIVETIHAGAGLIHSVFHLDAPSATLVIRNRHTDGAGPQYDYRGRRVAIDPFVKDPLLTRRMQCLDTLASLPSGGYRDAAIAIIANSDPLTCYRILEHVALRTGEDEHAPEGASSTPTEQRAPSIPAPLPSSVLTDLLDRARRRHGDWIDELPATLREVRRQRIISARRALITDPDHRYLLALLGNLHRRADILRLVEIRVPGRDPRTTVLDWMRAMSSTEIVGLELDETNETIVRLLLEDTAPADIPARLAEIYDSQDIEDQRDELIEHIERIRMTDIFQTVLNS